MLSLIERRKQSGDEEEGEGGGLFQIKQNLQIPQSIPASVPSEAGGQLPPHSAAGANLSSWWKISQTSNSI